MVVVDPAYPIEGLAREPPLAQAEFAWSVCVVAVVVLIVAMGAEDGRAMAQMEGLVLWYERMGATLDRNDRHLVAATFASSNEAIPDSLLNYEAVDCWRTCVWPI